MIISEITTINKTEDIEIIEKNLKKKFGIILRWAIVKVENDLLKISVTYKN